MEKEIKNLIGRVQSLDGKVIGHDMQPAKIRVSKDAWKAVLNEVTDKYLRKELTNEYLKKVAAEYSTTNKKIFQQMAVVIAQREIHKALGI